MNKIICCTLFFIGSIFGLSAQNWKLYSCATNPPNFGKLSYNEADEASAREDDLIGGGAKTICPEYIANLVNQLRSGSLDNDRKVLVIWLLGSLRPTDSNSIKTLIEYIDLNASKPDGKTRFQRWGYYPVAEALMNIGKSTINPIMQDLPEETSELRRRLLCAVLLAVEGKKGEVLDQADDKAIVQIQIRQRMAGYSDSIERANLELAVEELDCVKSPPDFSKLSYPEADLAAISDMKLTSLGWEAICPEYITNLVNELRQGNVSFSNSVPAIWLLGRLRPTDSDSIEYLIQHIDLVSWRDHGWFISRWIKYPAESALLDVGKPAIASIVVHLATETNELRRQLMCRVLGIVEGKDAALGQIKQRLATEANAAQKANLELSVKELEK